jgi:hypothetical protein
MKKYLSVVALLLAACVDHNSLIIDNAFNDPDWLKLEIPKGREAYAVAGNIDDTLLVATLTKAYYTIDQGKTWIESYNFQGPIMALRESNDTIFALQAYSIDEQGYEHASLAQYFTVDHGSSWKQTFYPRMEQRIGRVTSSSGIEYFLRKNTAPTAPGSTTAYVNPTNIMKVSANGEEGVSFQYKHNILNLHIDAEERLYVAASGGIYQPVSNTFFCCPDNLPAILYVSKKPRP